MVAWLEAIYAVRWQLSTDQEIFDRCTADTEAEITSLFQKIVFEGWAACSTKKKTFWLKFVTPKIVLLQVLEKLGDRVSELNDFVEE